MLGMNYGPADDPLAALTHRSAANISVYARGRDYHGLIKGKLKLLGSWLGGEAKNYGDAAELFVNAGAHYVALDFIAIKAAGGDLPG